MSNEWKTVRLGDICEYIRNGANIKQSDNAGGTPITRIETLSNDKFNRDRLGYADISDDKYSKYYLNNHDILMSHINSEKYLGRAVLYIKESEDETIIHGMNLLSLRALENKVIAPFLVYYFATVSFKSQIAKISKKSVNQASFSVSCLNKVNIPLPSIEKQREIAEVLDKASELVEKRKAQLAELDLLAESVFYDMFGDPKVNMHNFEQKEFQYCIDYMGDIGSNGANADVSRNLKMKDVTDYALMVRFVNLTANDFVNNVKYVSKETYDYFSKSKIYGGELIFCKIGSAGMNYIMPCLNKPVSLGLNQIMIKTNQMIVMSYLYRYLNTQYGEYLISTCINGAVTKSITKTALKKIPILLPPLSLQQQFAGIIEKIEEQKAKAKEALKESENLFQRLMQDMFNPDYHNS